MTGLTGCLTSCDRSPVSTVPTKAIPIVEKTKEHCELGMWVWKSKYIQDQAERRELIKFCQDNGIQRLLVQMHFVKGSTELDFPDALREFLDEAHTVGIKIEALDGGPEMGFASQREITLQKLGALLDFDHSLKPGQGFAGIHYDIEPYLTARWKAGEEQAVILETLATLRAVFDKVKKHSAGLLVAYDIPAWYDVKGETLTVDFEGQKKNVHEHLQDLSDYVGIMSYRRHAIGPNSVSELCKGELAYAEKTGKKIFPSLETIELKDVPQITFYGTSSKALWQTVQDVDQEMRASQAFGGIFLHQYASLKNLLATTPAQSAAPR